jgi:hypothetical protein
MEEGIAGLRLLSRSCFFAPTTSPFAQPALGLLHDSVDDENIMDLCAAGR